VRLDDFVGRLDGVTGGPEQFSAKCPGHEDRAASLSVSEDDAGAILVFCHAGCGHEEIVTAMGLQPKHLFPEHDAPIDLQDLASAKHLSVEFLRQHGLHDIEGAGVGITYRTPDGRSLVKVRSALAAKDGSRWPKGEPAVAYGLWRLPEFLAQQWLLLVEGETDTLTGWFYNYPTIGIPGAAAVKGTVTTSMLSGITTVYVVQEPDTGGEKFVRDFASHLAALGWAGTSRVIQFEGVKDLNDLHRQVGPRGFRDAFNAAASKSRSLNEVVATVASTTSTTNDATWPDPSPIASRLEPLPHLDADSLPAALGPAIDDAAYRMGCPVEFVAVPTIIAFATVMGRKVCIRPKTQDNWTVAPNLWGAVVSPPGTLKSPAADEGFRHLKAMEAAYRAQHLAQAPQHELRRIESKVRRTFLESSVKKAIENNQDLSSLQAAAAAALVPVPGPKRFITSDATVEKLAEVMAQNPNGVLYQRDELAGWLAQLEKDGHEGDRAFFLEGWDGKGDFTVDRIGRGTIYVPANCISLFGTIQPAVFDDYLNAAVRGGKDDDGLVQRIQLLVVGDEDETWQYVDAAPDNHAIQRAYNVFWTADQMNSGNLGAIHGDGLPYLRFTPSGQGLFNAWIAGHEATLRDPALHHAIRAHFAKYRSLVPSLALLFHIADVAGGLIPAGPVSEGALDLAIEWATLLEAHALRLYGQVLMPEAPAARLAERLVARELESGFTYRDISRKGWAGLKGDSIQEALDTLESANWLKKETRKTSGRDRTEYLVNPKVPVRGGFRQ
jgi:putative DNA primase/helicase